VDFRDAKIDSVDLGGADLRGTNLAETAFQADSHGLANESA
jgi:uncharacterized protein YjbI with pentapeptide repeats